MKAENDEALLQEQPAVPFSGEEAMGRFLDLHESYQTFINSKFGQQARVFCFAFTFRGDRKFVADVGCFSFL